MPTALVLPMDEPTFDIDADSRVITVPECFRKNGISVQGDQIAETIYFTIDRYVDTMDLALDSINVIIQWETAPVSTGKTTTTVKGISAAYLKDITLYENVNSGKLLFGWPLNNTITQSAGTIKFSVRFYRANPITGELIYSLSTLTAQATINPGLDYKWQGNQFAESIMDDSTIISGRIQNSIGPSDGKTAKEPTFLSNFSLPTGFNITLIKGQDEEGKPIEVTYNAIDLVKGTDDDDNQVFQRDFVVQASGEGLISYKWYYNDDLLLANDNKDSGIKYVVTEDTEVLGSHLYYNKVTKDNITSYPTASVVLGTEITEEMRTEGNEKCLYERVSFRKIETNGTNTVTGLHRVTACNKVGSATAYASQEIYIPGPDADTFELVIPEAMAEPVYLNETTGEATVSIQGKTARVTEGNMPGDTIVYTWTDVIPGEDEPVVTTVERTNESTSQAETHTITIPVENIASYDEDVAVSVYATRNGTSTEAQEHTFRITARAQAPEVTINVLDNNDSKYVVLNSPSSHVVLEATVGNYDDIIHNGEGDGLTFEWYKVVSDDDDTFDPTNDVVLLDPEHTEGTPCISIKDGVCRLTYQPDHILISGTNEKAGSGLFYCKVINTVNGSTAANDVSKITKADCIAITYAS